MRGLMVMVLALLLALPAGAQTELTFWTVSDARAAFLEGRAEAWNRLYPDRSVRIRAVVFFSDLIDEKLWTVLHSGVLVPGLESPDIADVEYQNFPKYINPLNCLFYPLDSVIRDANDAAKAYTFRNMCFGLPTGSGDMAVVYHAAKLAEAGVDPADIHSWDDFKRAAQAYKRATGEALLSVDMEHYLAFLTVYLQCAESGGVQSAHARALDRLGDLFQEGLAMFMPGGRADSKSFREALAEGDAVCAFVRSADFTYPGDESDYCMGAVPSMDDESGVWIPGWATCVTTSCADYALAMDFLGFAQPLPSAPASGVLFPGNADEVLPSIDRYEMQLASLALAD